MSPINHKKFFDQFKSDFDDTLTQEQTDGIEFLLNHFDGDPMWSDLRHVAYALSTILHETAGSMLPVEEGYYLGSAAKVKHFQDGLRYAPFFGRGYVQLTWRKNYQKASNALGIDFVSKPDLVMVPENAFKIMTQGMHGGWFTGKKLKDFIHGPECDYKEARTIINGHDKAPLIAGYARKFERILRRSSGEDTAVAVEVMGDPTGNAVEQTVATNSAGESAVITTTTATSDVTVPAPMPMGTMNSAAKVTILGLAVPPTIIALFKSIGDLVSQGYINAQDVGNTVMHLMTANIKYVFLLVGLILVMLIVKKVLRELVFLVTVISHAVPSMNSITVVAPEQQKETRWYQLW